MLLLDEPLGALDLKLRRQMQIELKRIQTEVGITFVHVTHDQEEAMTMADTVAVMNAGQIEQLGAPADIYEYPATAFVANFLGQSNLLAGEAAGRSGDDVLVTAHGARFSVPAGRARADRGPVFLGVRPEKLHLVGRRRPGARRPPARRRRGHRRLLRRGEHAVPGADRRGAASCPPSRRTAAPAVAAGRRRRWWRTGTRGTRSCCPATPARTTGPRRCSTSRWVRAP